MSYFIGPTLEEQKKERSKAQTLKKSLWWRQLKGKGRCYHCGGQFVPEELTMDHLIPISKGGKSTKKNCVPSCKKCNSEKGYKIPHW